MKFTHVDRRGRLLAGGANFLAVLWVGLLATSASAAQLIPLLNVDFQDSGGATESGFVSQTTTSQVHATPDGNLTVSVGGQDGFFNRGGLSNGGGLSIAEVYNDFVFSNSSNTLSFTIDGVIPDTAYEITWYSFDRASVVDSTTDFLPTGNTTGPVGQIVYDWDDPGDDPTTNDQYSFTGVWSTTGTALTIDADIIVDQFNRVNGFQLSRVFVPEPAGLTLWSAGTLAIARLVRRRRRGRR